MLEFIISNYLVFVIIAIILLLGLLGYMMDKRKYEQYRQEIVNEEKTLETLASAPDIMNTAEPVPVSPMQNAIPTVDPLTGNNQN